MRAWLAEWWTTIAMAALLGAVLMAPSQVESVCPGPVGSNCGCGEIGCSIPCSSCCPTMPCPIVDPTVATCAR